MMRQVEESIELQNVAAARAKQISRVALPGIVACLLADRYLLVRYL